ncbi:hypothetical protein M0802_013414 [Mischocyttarus mexicanus]|nr:hypothetical protein M0802_013414 [Mischocyttarus mexicanus]
MTRLEFITSIIQSITTEWMAEKGIDPEWSLGESSRSTTRPGIRKLPGRREKVCVVCNREDGGPVRRSRTICIHCYKGYMVCALVGINAKLIVRGVPAARCTCSTADLCTLVVHYEVLVLFLEAILFFFVYY